MKKATLCSGRHFGNLDCGNETVAVAYKTRSNNLSFGKLHCSIGGKLTIKSVTKIVITPCDPRYSPLT